MKSNLFKITEEEKNRIKNLHESVKSNPTIDSTLVLNEHQGTPGTAHRHSNPNACSNMTCCDDNGDGYCPAGTPKSCPDTGYAWNGRSCVSNKKSSQGCCDCRQTNPQPQSPMGGGGCPEIVGVVTAMGGSCREACRDFAPNLQSIKKPTQHSPTDPNEKESGLNERTYELPIRYGKKRMSESQLVKMLRRISEEQELKEEKKVCDAGACNTCGPGGAACKSCCDNGGPGCGDCSNFPQMVSADGPGKTKSKGGKGGPYIEPFDVDDLRMSRRGPSGKPTNSTYPKLNERKLTSIIKKVMFEMKELNEAENCTDDSASGADCTCCTGSGCAQGSCPGNGGACDCSGGGMVSAGGPGKTKGGKTKGGKPSCGSAKGCVSKLISMGLKPRSKSEMIKMLSESKNRRRYLYEEEEEPGFWEEAWEMFKEVLSNGYGGGMVTTGGGTGGGKSRGKKLNERNLSNIIRKVMYESELLTEEEACNFKGKGTTKQNEDCGRCVAKHMKPSGDFTAIDKNCFGDGKQVGGKQVGGKDCDYENGETMGARGCVCTNPNKGCGEKGGGRKTKSRR